MATLHTTAPSQAVRRGAEKAIKWDLPAARVDRSTLVCGLGVPVGGAP